MPGGLRPNVPSRRPGPSGAGNRPSNSARRAELLAAIVGLSRTDFLTALARFGVSPFQESEEDLIREARGG